MQSLQTVALNSRVIDRACVFTERLRTSSTVDSHLSVVFDELFETFERRVKGGVLFAAFLNDLNCMNDRRVISAELLADRREGCSRQLARKVHRHLPCEGE